jgi:hypothetical protein
MCSAEPFSLQPYNKKTLLELFSKKSGNEKELVKRKINFQYFLNYFEKMGAKTIICENNYTDRDYLEDYSAYYSRCLTDYGRRCSRLHFFSDKKIDADFFVSAIKNQTEENTLKYLKSNYLGFIIIKPLPSKFIGRTCLKTYSPVNGRNFPITRIYSVNLFGIELEVETLAFQEQDTVVAACATSALWSVFHGTGILFHHQILSPVEITRHATDQLPIRSRIFPNSGLVLEQMAHAIKDVGLEPFLVSGLYKNNSSLLTTNIYSYLKLGIPLIMGGFLYKKQSGKYLLKGSHAVAVTGFSLPDNYSIKDKSAPFCAGAIDKIYCHDDQIGPFARYKLKTNPGNTLKIPDIFPRYYLSAFDDDNYILVPNIILIPLYHKIRIPFEVARRVTLAFNELYKLMFSDLCWDIFLSKSNDTKKDVAKSSAVNKEEILLKSLPRFVWTLRAYGEKTKTLLFDILIDATDIESGDLFLCTVFHHKNSLEKFKHMGNKLAEIYLMAVEKNIIPYERSIHSILKRYSGD